MNIFFTSDHHFQHANIIKYSNRPFNSVAQMDEEMIRRWNEVVTHKDIVYHVGDFTLSDYSVAEKIIKRLKGTIFFIDGSHDRWLKEYDDGYPPRSASGTPARLLPPVCTVEERYKGDERIIVLCHYSLRSWDRSHYASWHLFGHHHNSLPPYGLSFDIGVDTHDFYPWSLEEVAQRMAKLQPIVDYSKTQR